MDTAKAASDYTSKAAQHLRAAAEQVRKFGPDGEAAARELEALALRLTWTGSTPPRAR
jgi:hypothetical protein